MSPCFRSSRKTNTEEEPSLTTTTPLFPARKSLSLLWNYPMFPFIVTSAGVCLPIWSYELIKGKKKKKLPRPHLSPCGLALYFYVKHPHSVYWIEGWIVARENERRGTRRKWALLTPSFLFTLPRGRGQALVSRATDSTRRGELRWKPQGQQSPTPLSSFAF